MAMLDSFQSPSPGPRAMEAERRRRAKAGREILRVFRPIPTAHDETNGEVAESKTTSSSEPVARLASDLVLTALTHAATHRLQAQRSFVSLFDQDHQYILAEGINGGVLDPQSKEHMFGGTMVDIGQGVCPVALEFFAKPDETYATETMYATSEYCHVPDLSLEPKFQACPLRQQFSGAMRFYLAVPLRAESGVTLGSLCVLDDTPRRDVSVADREYLQAVAKGVMEHLHLLRINARFIRADHLIRGLGLFVQGESTLRDWWLADADNASKADNLTANEKRQDLHRRANTAFGTVPRPDSLPPHGSITSPMRTASRAGGDENSSVTLSTPPSSLFSRRPRGSDAAASRGSRHEKDTASGNDSDGSPGSTPKSDEKLWPLDHTQPTPNASGVGAGVNQLFARASNIIREAVELEGVIFYDASTGIDNVRNDTNVSSDEKSLSTSGSSGDEASKEGRSLRTKPKKPRASDVLGFSTRSISSLAKNRPRRSTPSLSNDTVQLFLRHYPRGTVFSFDRDGVVSSSDEEHNGKPPNTEELTSAFNDGNRASSRSKRDRRVDATMIASAIPGVRSVAFCPIWDYNHQRWFAVFLAWSIDSNRLLDEDDLTYFTAFSNSAMAEKSRLEAIAADRTKSNFISSISHEMRSPLHGVLGNTELLRDVASGPVQHELIDMIEVCGRTLLDTMDHLLDHAKINHLTVDAKRGNRGRRKSRYHQALGQNVPVDMGSLVEDVVATVYAGYIHSSSSSTLFHMAQDARWSPTENEGIRSVAKNTILHTMVVVRIDELAKRSFVTQSGVWRRLLMNVFGNALKYTQSGYILVHLRAEDVSHNVSAPTGRSRMTLSVTDTGRGIANDYLKHRMFKPFSQENDLDVGVGLGLSIVHQLAQSIGAKINVQSEINIGTQISVSLDLDTVDLSPSLGSRLWSRLSEARMVCAGKEACFLGFDLLPSMSAQPDAELSIQSQQLVMLKSALTQLLRILDMTTSASLLPDRASASFFLVHESYIAEHAEARDITITNSDRQNPPWVVFCKDNPIPQHVGPTRFDVAHPFSPSNILSVILQCLGAPCDPRAGEKTNEAPSSDTSSASTIKAMEPSSKMAHRPSIITIEELGQLEATPGSGMPLSSLSPQSPPPTPRQGLVRQGTTEELESAPGQYRVLIVDDNAINVKLLASFMRKMGYFFMTASNGAEAVQRYADAAPAHFDLVLMDMSMPVMDGFEATRRIRGCERDAHLPAARILAVSGLGSTDAQQSAIDAGVDRFLTKPIGFRALQELIQGLRQNGGEEDVSENGSGSESEI